MERPDLGGEGSERMPQIVETESGLDWERLAIDPRSEHRVIQRRSYVALWQRSAELVREYEIVRPGESLAPAKRVETRRCLIDEWDRSDLAGLGRAELTPGGLIRCHSNRASFK